MQTKQNDIELATNIIINNWSHSHQIEIRFHPVECKEDNEMQLQTQSVLISTRPQPQPQPQAGILLYTYIKQMFI